MRFFSSLLSRCRRTRGSMPGIIGPPILTKYERAQILGTRITELSRGAPTSIEIDPDEQYTLQQIAQMELDSKCMPVKIVRRCGQTKQVIDVNQLEVVDN